MTGETLPMSFRLSRADRERIERLQERFRSPAGRPMPAVDVVRLALDRLESSGEGAEKNPRKK